MSSLQSCSVIVFLSAKGRGAFPRMSRKPGLGIAEPKPAIGKAANAGSRPSSKCPARSESARCCSVRLLY